MAFILYFALSLDYPKTKVNNDLVIIFGQRIFFFFGNVLNSGELLHSDALTQELSIKLY